MTKKIVAAAIAGLMFFALGHMAHSYKTGSTADQISMAAQEFVSKLDDADRKVALYPVDSPKLVGWHFIPKDERKGLEMNAMSETQRVAAHALLKSVLSQVGYSKATQIMQLESLLKELQDKNGGRGPIRDPLRYYFTLFGDPGTPERWALSVEGHHLSLNFVVEGDKVVSSTPQFFATNPATVKSENDADFPLGTRILRKEETLAFELVNTLSKRQREVAILSDTAPREIRAAGEPQPPADENVGIAWGDLSKQQRRLLKRLIESYVKAMPASVAQERMNGLAYEGVKFTRGPVRSFRTSAITIACRDRRFSSSL